jgi:hypothetical protein
MSSVSFAQTGATVGLTKPGGDDMFYGTRAGLVHQAPPI